jgi:hypothetical protein
VLLEQSAALRGYHSQSKTENPKFQMSEPLAKKVLLIGWDAADWKVATPLLEQGLMPALDDFINHGVMGNLATLQPVLSPMLWNSIATGQRADKHGIHGFAEPDPNTGGVRMISSTSRKVKAIWNILTQRGYKTHALGWFAGHPAEPINGICVSDLYPLATAPHDKPWPLPPGAVHPESLRDQLAELRIHPAELDAGAILPFVPQAEKVDQQKDKGLATVAKVLADPQRSHLDFADAAVGLSCRLLQRHRPLLSRLHALPPAAHGRRARGQV